MSKDAHVPSVESNPTRQGPPRRRELTSPLGPGCPQCAACLSFPREQRGLNHDTSHLPSALAISCQEFLLFMLENRLQQWELLLIEVIKAIPAEIQGCDLLLFNSELCLRR